MQEPVYYGDYLQLERLLSSQNRKSVEAGKPAHDEMLFIIVHQTYELWFKQILHELDSVLDLFRRDYVDEKNIGVALSRLARITEIQRILIYQLHILETMTPMDFLEFRDLLIPASGFQSVQFRLIEIKLGMQEAKRVRYEKVPYYQYLSERHRQELLATEQQLSLFSALEKWLERTPFLEFDGFDFWQNYRKAVENMLAGDFEMIRLNPTLDDEARENQLAQHQKTVDHFATLFDESKYGELIALGQRRMSYRATIAALLIYLYRDQPILQMPFRLLTTITDIDELMTAWRYRHALMVQRMIGMKIGTGGSSGHAYLRKTADKHKIFSDLFNMSTFLIPRSDLPELPEHVQRQLGFYYQGEA